MKESLFNNLDLENKCIFINSLKSKYKMRMLYFNELHDILLEKSDDFWYVLNIDTNVVSDSVKDIKISNNEFLVFFDENVYQKLQFFEFKYIKVDKILERYKLN